jgi:hypothetical protein
MCDVSTLSIRAKVHTTRPQPLSIRQNVPPRAFYPGCANSLVCSHTCTHEQKGPPPVGYRGAGGFAPEEQSEPRPPPPGADPGYVEMHHIRPQGVIADNFP